MAHRNLLVPHQCGVPRTTMGRLRAVTEPVQGWGNLHNLIGDSQQYPEAPKDLRQQKPSRAPKYLRGTSSRELQVPKSNKLLNFNFHESSWRTQTDATDAMGKNTRSVQVLHSQIPPKQLMLWGEKRGRTRKNTKSLQDLDPQASPH